MHREQASAHCLFPLDDLEDFFPRRFIERGQRYFEEGRVQSLEIKTDLRQFGAELICIGHARAQVRGRERTPYEVNFFWESGSNELLDINGWCTCPVGHHCKHMAAVAFAAHQHLQHQQRNQHVEDWSHQLDQLHHALTTVSLPPDTTDFIAWIVVEKPVHQALIPLITRRSKQNPQRLLKGRRLKVEQFDPAITSLDEALLRYQNPFTDEVPLDGLSPSLIALLVRSGRVWLADDYQQVDHALRWSDKALSLPLKWTQTQQLWHLSIPLPESQQLWKSPQPWLVLDRQHRTLHPVDLPLPCWQLETLLEQHWRLPDPDTVAAFSTRWRSLFGDDFPIPPPQKTSQHVETTEPVAVLMPRRLTEYTPLYVLELKYWQYGETRIVPDDPHPLVEDGPHLWQRLPERETDTLAQFDAWLADQPWPLEPVHEGNRHMWLYRGDDLMPYASLLTFHELHEKHAATLAALHVRIEWPAELPPVHEAAPPHARLRSEEGSDHLLALDLTVDIEGQTLPLIPVLTQLLRQLPPGAPLPPAIAVDVPAEGDQHPRLYRLPTEPLKPYLELLYSLHARGALDENRPVRLHALEALPLTEIDAETDRRSRETLNALARLKADTPLPDVAPPQTFRATLRPYQQQGVNWLQFLRQWQLNGILADDMGLGKTVQTLAHLCIEKAEGRLEQPALIVAPTSVAGNWRSEAAQFAPELRVCLLHGLNRQKHFDTLNEYDVVITTYPLISRDFETLAAHRWQWVILDEAHQIKNPRAKVSRLVRQLPAQHRLCLTGTPVENHLGELWSLFDFLMPGLLGNMTHFRKHWRTPIEKQGQTHLLQQLQRKLAPLMLRRTKSQVVSELPPKNEIVLRIPLEPAQRKLYDTMRLALDEEIREVLARQGLENSQITVLNALLKLRQICCDPALLKDAPKGRIPPSAKLDALVDMVQALISEGRRILIFSQFAQMLKRIQTRLQAEGIEPLMLTGQTTDRDSVIRRFRDGEVPVFLISLKAGGVGINLTEADTVILYDPWWNPAAENQAIDRAYRIGQDKTVFVYRLIAEDTLEERILELQARKQQLAQSVHTEADPEQPGFRLTEEDIRHLFQAPDTEETVTT